MRTIRVAVHTDGRVTVSAAKNVPIATIERMLTDKQAWIETQQARMRSRPRLVPPASAADYRRYKSAALALAEERIQHFSQVYGCKPTALSIRNPRTRWGSCSRRGKISLSYRLIFLPAELRDYLIVHELCHLKEFNHSPRFWQLVQVSVPDYLRVRRILRVA